MYIQPRIFQLNKTKTISYNNMIESVLHVSWKKKVKKGIAFMILQKN